MSPIRVARCGWDSGSWSRQRYPLHSTTAPDARPRGIPDHIRSDNVLRREMWRLEEQQVSAVTACLRNGAAQSVRAFVEPSPNVLWIRVCGLLVQNESQPLVPRPLISSAAVPARRAAACATSSSTAHRSATSRRHTKCSYLRPMAGWGTSAPPATLAAFEFQDSHHVSPARINLKLTCPLGHSVGPDQHDK